MVVVPVRATPTGTAVVAATVIAVIGVGQGGDAQSRRGRQHEGLFASQSLGNETLDGCSSPKHGDPPDLPTGPIGAAFLGSVPVSRSENPPVTTGPQENGQRWQRVVRTGV